MRTIDYRLEERRVGITGARGAWQHTPESQTRDEQEARRLLALHREEQAHRRARGLSWWEFRLVREEVTRAVLEEDAKK